MHELRPSWLRGWRGIGAISDGGEIYAALIARYNEPHRKYHALQHLAECLRLFATVQNLSPYAAEIEVALWFHDAIYDVHRHDNEELSAEWARAAVIQGGASAEIAERIYSLIMVTKHTGAPTLTEEQLLVDVDLSILGASQERFAEYEHQIREEYAFVPEVIFKEKRRDILKSFLDRSRLYGTAYFHDKLEMRARANLRAAIG